ncbi:MAG: M81 family metallopeptidase, partial [Planctomycetes bacterium]|nr:M81 family metallopeptidase [Planctomycetota bacterium]
MKIAVGLFYLECNTNNPDLVGKDSFIFAEGEASLPYLHAVELLRKEGCDIVPTIMASALPA